MVQCLVGLGSNLGERRELLDAAVQQLSQHCKVLSASDWFSYPAIGPAPHADATKPSPTPTHSDSPQPGFLNGVVLVDSPASPQETVNILHELEASAGRKRVVRWSSRTLDADLLLHGDQIVDTDSLQVPHPRMMSRRFVLEPACQVAPEMVHPSIGWTIKQLFQHLQDSKPYFAVIGSRPCNAKQLVERLVDATGGKAIPSIASAVSSSDGGEVLQSPPKRLASERNGFGQPQFSDFWIGQLSLQKEYESIAWHSDWHPKLVLVTDSRASDFANHLANVRSELRVPTIFLSANEGDAWQDALGAVQGMC